MIQRQHKILSLPIRRGICIRLRSRSLSRNWMQLHLFLHDRGANKIPVVRSQFRIEQIRPDTCARFTSTVWFTGAPPYGE